MRQRDEERALLERCAGERVAAATEDELRTLLDEVGTAATRATGPRRDQLLLARGRVTKALNDRRLARGDPEAAWGDACDVLSALGRVIRAHPGCFGRDFRNTKQPEGVPGEIVEAVRMVVAAACFLAGHMPEVAAELDADRARRGEGEALPSGARMPGPGTLVVADAPLVVRAGEQRDVQEAEMRTLVGQPVAAIESGPRHLAVYVGGPDGGRVLLGEWVGRSQVSLGDWTRQPKQEG